MVSVLILTLNEEATLGECLKSVAWSDDVLVFDSYSSDRTQSITQEFGARFLQRKFDDYASQRNAGLAAGFNYPWVLMVDADERVPEELREELLERLPSVPDEVALFRMRRKDHFMGKWIRRSSGYPTWFGRLVRLGRVRVERDINEEYVTDGQILHLDNHLLHYPFAKGLSYWLERHNKYSSMEARRLLAEIGDTADSASLFSSDPTVRRKALKQLAFRLPGRPFVVFAYLAFIRMGVLDGRAGLLFILLRCFYEFMIDLKVKEIRRQAAGKPL